MTVEDSTTRVEERGGKVILPEVYARGESKFVDLPRPISERFASYNHYVELVEPADKRACIKCCDNFDDCPLDRGRNDIDFQCKHCQ
jgi:hypothetical protein